VSLDGVHVRILVAIPEEDQRLVTGPVQVEVATAASVKREVLLTDEGFNGLGEQVIFTDLRGDPGTEEMFPAVVRVKVPIAGSGLRETPHVPVQVEVIPGSARGRDARGTSNLTTLGFAVETRYETAPPDEAGTGGGWVPIVGTGDTTSPGATDPNEPEADSTSDPAETDTAGSESTTIPTTP
jgi:hypothetical protein